MSSLVCGRQREYAVALRRGLLEPNCADLGLAIGDRRALVVTSPTVDRCYGPALRQYCRKWGIEHRDAVLPLDERAKTMDSVLQICELAADAGLRRRDVMVAFGGGVVSDLTSVAASLYRRGVPCLRLPTSLIGQIDAGIGVKSAVNTPTKKSALGAFEPPEAVLGDPGWLATLPARAVRSGVAELIKIAALKDAHLFALVARDAAEIVAAIAAGDECIDPLLTRAIDLMLDELGSNPFEDCLERLVDFGHTFSPVLEIASQHALTHGEAVAVDMAYCVVLSQQLGLLPHAAAETFLATLAAVGLPVDNPVLDVDVLRRGADEAVAHRGGALNLVLLRDIGEPVFLRDRRELSDARLGEARHELFMAAASSRDVHYVE